MNAYFRIGCRVRFVALAISWLLIQFAQAPAAVLTWNTAVGYPPQDGSGTWGTGGNWWNGSANVAWSNGSSDTAIFGAATGTLADTVAVSGSQSAGGIVFQSQAYTLGGSSGTLNLAGPTPSITVNASGGTIAAIITGSAEMTKAGTGALTLAAASPYTGPVHIAAGALKLSAANGAAGAISSGTITVGSGGSLLLNAADALGYTAGIGALVVNGGTVANTVAGGRITLANPIAMMGGLLTGSGTGDSGGVYSVNSANGVIATSDSAGNAAIINAKSISPEGFDLNFNVTRGKAAPISDLTVASAIIPFNSSTYGIAKSGNGVLTLTGSNTYTGPTTVSDGTLVLGSGGTTGSLSPGGSIAVINNATLGFCRSNAVVQGVDFSRSGIGGSGGLVQLGGSLLTLNAMNAYGGPTVVAGGTLAAGFLADGGAASNIGKSSNDSANLVVENGAVFQYTGTSVSIGRGFTIGPGGGGINVAGGTQLQFGNSLILDGTLAKTGGGTLLLTNYAGSAVSGGAIVVSQGTLDLDDSCYKQSPFGYRALSIQVNAGGNLDISAPHALGGDAADANTSWGVVDVLGGTMSLAAEQYISGGTVNSSGRLVLQGAAVENAGAGELRSTANTSRISTLVSGQTSTIDVPLVADHGLFAFDVADGPADADLLVAGNISSSGGSNGIAKLNAGKLVLTGSNSYGGTTVSGGTLQIGAGGNSGTLGLGAVWDNATLSFARSGTVMVTSAVSGSGSLVQLGPGILELNSSNSYSGGTVVSAGTLILNNSGAIEDGTSLIVGGDAAFAPAPLADAASTSIASVPEPGTLALLALGLGWSSIRALLRSNGRRLRRVKAD